MSAIPASTGGKMFSLRTQWDLRDNALTQAVAARRAAGLPILDLTVGNPTCTDLPMPHAAIADALQVPDNRTYAPEPFGLPAARRAVAAYHGTRVPPEHIAITASTSEAYAWLFKLLCDAGDRVLVPAPSYPLFEYLAALELVHADPYPSRFVAGEWHVDLRALAEAVTDRTRAVLVVSPNNPTGAVLQPHELHAIAALCAERGLALVCDEVFADTLDLALPDRVATLAGHAACLTFVLSGLSKVCLLPQLKLGWLAASGPPDLLAEALRRLEVIADTYLSVGTPVQHALPALLGLRAGIQAVLQARLRQHRQLLVQALAGTTASVLPADGGWSAILRVPCLHPEEALHLLQTHGVLTQPGWYFDLPGDGFLVLSLLPDDAVFVPAVAALAAAFAVTPGR